MMVNTKISLRTHCFMPITGLCVASILIAIGNVDRHLADYFYSIQGNSWAWKESWLAEDFFHKGGRSLSILLALLLLVLVIASRFSFWLSPHKKPLLYLFVATAGSSLLISLLKSSLAVSCPWEFDRYGGDLPYANVFDQLVLRNGEGCFPAGHASAGYAWISAYFLGVHYQSRWRWLGLAIPLLVGMVLGVVQQIRGAHFLSHDLWSLAICWFFSLSMFFAFFSVFAKGNDAKELVCQ
ncbi:MAG TPA: phosphatase PAP2 family protein [Cellvibrio sp.]